MTLAFSTQWPQRMGALANQPNYFVSKVWRSLYKSIKDFPIRELEATFFELDGKTREKIGFVQEKRHTIRKGNRWRAGLKIHPVINNRTKNRFQFAPTILCTSVQDIEINYTESPFALPYLKIGDSKPLIDDVISPSQSRYGDIISKLAINDGFDSVSDFLAYFNTDFKGQIIHWTNLKY